MQSGEDGMKKHITGLAGLTRVAIVSHAYGFKSIVPTRQVDTNRRNALTKAVNFIVTSSFVKKSRAYLHSNGANGRWVPSCVGIKIPTHDGSDDGWGCDSLRVSSKNSLPVPAGITVIQL